MLNTQDIQKAGFDFATGFSQAISNQLGEIIHPDKIANIFNNIISNATSSADLGQTIGTKFGEFAKHAMKGTGWSSSGAGSDIGSGVNDFLRHLVKDINMKTVTGDFMNEFSDAFNAGMDPLRKGLYYQMDSIRDDIQSIFSNIARDIALETIPWVALGGAVLIGTPLLTWYIYKKAVYNIGRPQLAQEVRKVGIWDRTTDGAIRTISSLWDSTKLGLQWSVLAGSAGLTLTITGLIASGLITGRAGLPGDIIEGLGCFFFGNRYYCDTTPALPLVALTVGAGTLRATIHTARSFFNFIKKSMRKDVQPVFSEELQRRIDELTAATYNIHQNGGFLQNVLLYGPGGTGKTMISKYIAENSKMNYFMMSGGDLAQYIRRGEHVTEVNKIFKDAESSYSPTIIFIDECESLCGDRGKMTQPEFIELINCFLNHTGEPSKKVMVMLTTNRKDDLDPAVLSRMDHKLYIGPPEQPERKKIIETYLPTFMTPLEREELFTETMITQIANQTEGFTGRTIFKMFNVLSAKRASTKDNKLTSQMVHDTVSTFVKQEAEIEIKSDSKMRQSPTEPKVTGPVTPIMDYVLKLWPCKV